MQYGPRLFPRFRTSGTDQNSVMAYPEFRFVERWYALGFSALFFLVPGAFRRSPLRDGSPLIGPKCNSRTAWVSPMCHSRDLTDEPWKTLDALIPKPRTRSDGRGRPWKSRRSVINGILWVLRTGAPWADLPDRYPRSRPVIGAFSSGFARVL
jgi:hypothetical protein